MQNIPSWMLTQFAESEMARARAQQATYSQQVEIIDSPLKVRGYREVCQEFHLGQHPIYPRDEAVTKALQRLDPTIVPMWVNWVFYKPGTWEIECFPRHVVAAALPDPKGEKPLIECHVPHWYRGPRPNSIVAILQGDPNPEYRDLPGEYRPWDWNLYYEMVAARVDHLSVKEQQKLMIHDKLEREEKERQFRLSEHEYKLRDLDRYVTKKLEQISEVEMKEYALYGRKAMGRN